MLSAICWWCLSMSSSFPMASQREQVSLFGVPKPRLESLLKMLRYIADDTGTWPTSLHLLTYMSCIAFIVSVGDKYRRFGLHSRLYSATDSLDKNEYEHAQIPLDPHCLY